MFFLVLVCDDVGVFSIYYFYSVFLPSPLAATTWKDIKTPAIKNNFHVLLLMATEVKRINVITRREIIHDFLEAGNHQQSSKNGIAQSWRFPTRRD